MWSLTSPLAKRISGSKNFVCPQKDFCNSICQIGDINCRDCDVRSLAEPEPNQQVFVSSSTSVQALCKAAARSAETIFVIIGEILRAFTPTECANHFRNSGYANPKSIMV